MEKDKTNQKVENLMSILEELPKTKASIGFFERTKYRLEHQEDDVKENIYTKILQHAITPTLVGASIILGVFIGLDNDSSYVTSGIDAMMETYSMEVSEAQQIINIE